MTQFQLCATKLSKQYSIIDLYITETSFLAAHALRNILCSSIRNFDLKS